MSVVQVPRAESDPPQAVRPDWEWRYLASGSGGRVQRVPLLRMTSTDVAAVSFPPVMIIPSKENKNLKIKGQWERIEMEFCRGRLPSEFSSLLASTSMQN